MEFSVNFSCFKGKPDDFFLILKDTWLTKSGRSFNLTSYFHLVEQEEQKFLFVIHFNVGKVKCIFVRRNVIPILNLICYRFFNYFRKFQGVHLGLLDDYRVFIKELAL